MMNFRRPPMDRVNPRHVPPSRHAIFIRGLPGSTNVDSVKEHFTNETNSKCSVEFFSTSEENNRFSVAIRFKNNEIARNMMEKYNGKNLMGAQVEINWFKDLKKARARAFEDHRNGRFRGGFRGNFRGGSFRGIPDRRGRHFSPQNYGARRIRNRSRSGDAAGREGPRRAVSRSPSCSSRSSSRSISRSRSPKRPRQEFENEPRARDGTENNSVTRKVREHSRRSRSRSSTNSSSRSSSNNSDLHPRLSGTRDINNENNNFSGRPGNFSHRVSVSPIPGSTTAINDQFAGRQNSATRQNTLSFSPVHPIGDDTGLLSGLIQLTSRPKSSHKGRSTLIMRRGNHTSSAHSGSRCSSVSSVSSASSVKKAQRRLRPASPPMPSPLDRSSKPAVLSPPNKPLDAEMDFPKRSRQSSDNHIDRWRPVNYQETTKAPIVINSRHQRQPPNLYENDEMEVVDEDDPSPQLPQQQLPIRNVSTVSSNDDSNQPRTSTSPPTHKLSSSKNANMIKTRGQRYMLAHISPERDSWSEINQRNLLSHEDINRSPPRDQISAENTVKEVVKDKQTIIQERKSSIEEEYKRDCETFATVVRTLISKDNDLEPRLLPLLKEILHERGQRCIEELRASIAENQGGT